jgi:hypothetical protein
MAIDKLMIEKNIELRSTAITEIVEVVKVDAEKLFVNQQLNQQIKIQRNQKLKKKSQKNMYSKKRIAIYIRIIRREILRVHKGNCVRDQAIKALQVEYSKVEYA